jgi:hypothetical protein
MICWLIYAFEISSQSGCCFTCRAISSSIPSQRYPMIWLQGGFALGFLGVVGNGFFQSKIAGAGRESGGAVAQWHEAVKLPDPAGGGNANLTRKSPAVIAGGSP